MMSNVNHDLIFSELLKSVTTDTEEHLSTKGDKKFIIREYLTIGFKTGRQSGTTEWVAKKLQENPKAVLFVPNDSFVKHYRAKRFSHDEGYGPVFPEDTHKRILNTWIFEGGGGHEAYALLNEADYVFIERSGILHDIPPGVMRALVENFSSDRVIVVLG